MAKKGGGCEDLGREVAEEEGVLVVIVGAAVIIVGVAAVVVLRGSVE